MIVSLENSIRLSYKVKHTLTIWPFLDIDPREMTTYVQMFLAALFRIAKTPEATQIYPSTGEWINKC